MILLRRSDLQSTVLPKAKVFHSSLLSSNLQLTLSLDGTYNPFISYNFTGAVRPRYPLSPRRIVPDHIPRPDYADDGKMGFLSQMKTTCKLLTDPQGSPHRKSDALASRHVS
jgi:hypothetical protein